MKTLKINFNKKQIAIYFGLSPASVYQWFPPIGSPMVRTLPTADKVAQLYKKFGIPPEYWANPNSYILEFNKKNRTISRLQKEHNGTTEV